jgi:predicted N-acyltransferase
MGEIVLFQLGSILDIEAADFSRLVDAGEPFQSRAFLGALETHDAVAARLGWTPRHIAARNRAGRIVGLMPLYLKTNSFGEFIYDWSWARAFEQNGQRYYPKLFCGIPYTPATGLRLWVENGEDGEHAAHIREALVTAAIAIAEKYQLSSLHVAFPSAPDQAVFEEAGFLVRRDVQYHWHNRNYRDFDDYLTSFSSDKRRKVRAERRKVAEAGVEIAQYAGDGITPALWQKVHALYAATFDKYGNHPALSADCLAEIGQALGRRMVVFVATLDGEAVATSICFRNARTLYGRYWGADRRIEGLHFELCYYQGIEYCLREGLQCFEPGAGGEHKIARGFEPTEVTTMHWIADPRMREVLREYLGRIAAQVGEYSDEVREHLPFRNVP